MSKEETKTNVLDSLAEAHDILCPEGETTPLGGKDVPIKKIGMKALIKMAQVLGKNFGIFMEAIDSDMASMETTKVLGQVLGKLTGADLAGDLDKLIHIMTEQKFSKDVDYDPDELLAFIIGWAKKNEHLKKTSSGFTDLVKTMIPMETMEEKKSTPED